MSPSKGIIAIGSLFVAIGLVPVAQAANPPIYTPEAIVIPSGKGPDQVKKAIRKAAFDKGWEIREVGAGHMQAKHAKPGRKGAMHIAVVDIRLNAKSIRITYKNSQDLDYDAGAQTINKTYNRWLQYLEKNIRANLGAY